MFLALSALYAWTAKTTDIKSAFLQGKPMDRNLCIHLPKGFEVSGYIWKLNTCLYGLNDAARKLYLSVKDTLLDSGCKTAEYEPSLFVYKVDNVLNGLLLTHVDDFLHAGQAQSYLTEM